MARAAEEGGFDSIWVGDHLLYRGDGRPERGPWEAWTLLGGARRGDGARAARPARRVRGFHPPGLIAKMAATIDEVSGGRFVLGLGAGWNEEEFRAFGMPVRPPRLALRGGVRDRPAAAGRRARDARRALPPGRGRRAAAAAARRPPLMIGSNGPRMLAHRAPARRRLEHLVRGLRQHRRGLRGAQRADHARRRATAGRDPAEIERSACVLRRAGRRRPASARRTPERAAARGPADADRRAPARAGRGRRRRGDPGRWTRSPSARSASSARSWRSCRSSGAAGNADGIGKSCGTGAGVRAASVCGLALRQLDQIRERDGDRALEPGPDRASHERRAGPSLHALHPELTVHRVVELVLEAEAHEPLGGLGHEASLGVDRRAPSASRPGRPPRARCRWRPRPTARRARREPRPGSSWASSRCRSTAAQTRSRETGASTECSKSHIVSAVVSAGVSHASGIT